MGQTVAKNSSISCSESNTSGTRTVDPSRSVRHRCRTRRLSRPYDEHDQPPSGQHVRVEIACADCGCLVDRGVVLVRCGDPECCCRELPEPERI